MQKNKYYEHIENQLKLLERISNDYQETQLGYQKILIKTKYQEENSKLKHFLSEYEKHTKNPDITFLNETNQKIKDHSKIISIKVISGRTVRQQLKEQKIQKAEQKAKRDNFFNVIFAILETLVILIIGFCIGISSSDKRRRY